MTDPPVDPAQPASGGEPEIGGVSWTTRGREAIVTLTGEHDLASRDMVEITLRTAATGSTRVVVDLSRCTFIDCSVIGAINHVAAATPLVVFAPAETAATVRLLLDLIEAETTRVHPWYAVEGR